MSKSVINIVKNKEPQYTYTNGNSYIKNSKGSVNVIRTTYEEIRNWFLSDKKAIIIAKTRIAEISNNPYRYSSACSEVEKYIETINNEYRKTSPGGRIVFNEYLEKVIEEVL